MSASDEGGLHDAAFDFDDHDKLVSRFNSLRFESITSFRTAEGRGATYLDTIIALGHAPEIYMVNDSLLEPYSNVKQAAETWDGKKLTINL